MADLLTTRQVQDILQVDRTTIYRMVESGQLPAIRVGKQWRFERATLERWLSGRPAVPQPVPDARLTAVASFPPSAGASLSELLPGKCAQMIQDSFADALGVTIVITDMQGRPLTQVSNPCGLYAAVLRDEESVARCIQEWQRMAGTIPLEPRFSANDLGLLCARGLIRVGNELKGMVFFGGVAPEQWPPSAEQIEAMAAHFEISPDTMAAHIAEVHHMDRQERNRVLSYVQRIGDVFSQLLEDRGALTARLHTIATLIASVEGPAEAQRGY